MSEQGKNDSLSRRRALQAAVAIMPLHVANRVAAALPPVGMTRTTQHFGDSLLALGAREAVARIASGDITAEAYVAQLLKQYDAHKDLNVANAIDGARVLEAARAVDRSRGRGGLSLAQRASGRVPDGADRCGSDSCGRTERAVRRADEHQGEVNRRR